MMWFFRHFRISITYHIFLLNQVQGAIAIPPSYSAPLPLVCPSIPLSVHRSVNHIFRFLHICWQVTGKEWHRVRNADVSRWHADVSRWLTLSIHGCLWILLLVCLSVHLSVCSFTAFSGASAWAWKKKSTFWHTDVSRSLTLKVLLLCRSWGACVPRRSQRLYQLEFWLLVGTTMLDRLWARGQTKCNTPLMLATSVFGRILLKTLLCDVLVEVQAGHLMAQWRGMHGSCLVPFVMLTPTILRGRVPSWLRWWLGV